jgi:hypothetical protein
MGQRQRRLPVSAASRRGRRDRPTHGPYRHTARTRCGPTQALAGAPAWPGRATRISGTRSALWWVVVRQSSRPEPYHCEVASGLAGIAPRNRFPLPVMRYLRLMDRSLHEHPQHGAHHRCAPHQPNHKEPNVAGHGN